MAGSGRSHVVYGRKIISLGYPIANVQPWKHTSNIIHTNQVLLEIYVYKDTYIYEKANKERWGYRTLRTNRAISEGEYWRGERWRDKL